MLVWTRRILAAALLASATGVALAPLFAADPDPKAVKASLPDAPKQQDADLAFLKAAIEKKAKNSVLPVRSTAIIVAQNAQARMGTDAALAGLRDQMIKISDALQDTDKPDWAAAQKALDGVKGAKGKTDPVKLEEAKEFDLATLMNSYKSAKRGGRGWEEQLEAQAKKATDADVALEIAQGSYLIGQLAEKLKGEKVMGAAKEKQWAGLVADMQKVSAEAATEAAKGKKADMTALTKKLAAIEANCVACHNVFRK